MSNKQQVSELLLLRTIASVAHVPPSVVKSYLDGRELPSDIVRDIEQALKQLGKDDLIRKV